MPGPCGLLPSHPMKVINTRPATDADPFTAAIRAAGAEPVLSPVMAIRFRDTAAPVQPEEALAFTSANGVRAFARANSDRGIKIFAVGGATADEARGAGFVDVKVAGGNVESLATLIAGSKAPLRILHLAGSHRAGDLVAALAERGVPSRRLVLYDAVPAAHLALEARLVLETDPQTCAVGLFSPRSATLFLTQARRAGVEERLSGAILLAFSDAVAAAALANRWGAVKIARERSLRAMAALLRA